MSLLAGAYLNHLLDSSGDSREDLFDFLPDETRSLLEQSQGLDFSRFKPANEELESVHYSWFLDFLKERTPVGQKLFLSYLSEAQREGLKRLLNLDVPALTLNKGLKAVLGAQLNRHFELEKALLSANEENPPTAFLIDLDKNQWVRLIDYLGLLDLSIALKQLVDKKMIQRVYSLLSEKRQKFLRKMSATNPTVINPKIDLKSWNGSERDFAQMLQKRGMTRLAYALKGAPKGFMWRALHKLDSGRAGYLEKTLAKLDVDQKFHEKLVEQVKSVHDQIFGS